MATFALPVVEQNSDGWGPTDVAPELKNVPFAPFSKSDKLGRASDWTNTSYPRVHGGAGRHGPAANVFNFTIDNEESNFHLVDSRPTRSKNFGQRRAQQQYQKRDNERDQERNRPGQSFSHQPQRGKQAQLRSRQFNWREQRNQVNYSPSVDIRPEWTVLEQIHFPLLQKLTLKVGEPVDVLKCGVLEYYDRATDRVTPKTAISLAKTHRAFRSVTTSDDKIMKKVALEGGARVFITDSILTALMCTPRSVYAWDIVITRKGNCIWFDKRPDSQVDKETVNETAPEPVPEDDTINGVEALAFEATAIRQNFSQQCLDHTQTLDLGNPNPFQVEGSSEQLASIGYRYRKWNLGDDMDILVRCELDAVINHRGEDQLLAIRTFNQSILVGADTDWKRKLERQSAAVLAIEAKNNSNKVARWTLSALLAGCDMMKVGFTTRVSPKDNANHQLLVTQMQKPKDLAAQLNINLDNCWAIVRSIVDLCVKLEKDNYLLMKDPNKQLLYLYEIPANAFATQYDDEMDDGDTALPLASGGDM